MFLLKNDHPPHTHVIGTYARHTKTTASTYATSTVTIITTISITVYSINYNYTIQLKHISRVQHLVERRKRLINQLIYRLTEFMFYNSDLHIDFPDNCCISTCGIYQSGMIMIYDLHQRSIGNFGPLA